MFKIICAYFLQTFNVLLVAYAYFLCNTLIIFKYINTNIPYRNNKFKQEITDTQALKVKYKLIKLPENVTRPRKTV